MLDPGDCWALRRAQIHRSVPGHPARCAHVPGRGGDEQESLCIPLSAHGHWLGVMTMSLPSEADLAEGRNMEELEGLARSVADQFGMALSNLQLRDRLRTLSIRDPLTGLYNRRYLEETVQREVHRALRHRTPLSVLMVDVDHFKAFNDNHGHQMADGVLRSVATTLSNNTRAEDVACRYGGEEFVLLLPDAAIADAASRADYLRQLVYDETEQNVTVSIGVASFPTDGSTWEEVLKAADDAMYRAKARGRDQVVVSGDHSASARTPKGSSDPSSTPIGLVGNPV